jgi:hypothetical protein
MARKESWNEISYTIVESKQTIRSPIRGIKFIRAARMIEGCIGMLNRNSAVMAIAQTSRILFGKKESTELTNVINMVIFAPERTII